jgi:hypothetical protein
MSPGQLEAEAVRLVEVMNTRAVIVTWTEPGSGADDDELDAELDVELELEVEVELELVAVPESSPVTTTEVTCKARGRLSRLARKASASK